MVAELERAERETAVVTLRVRRALVSCCGRPASMREHEQLLRGRVSRVGLGWRVVSMGLGQVQYVAIVDPADVLEVES